MERNGRDRELNIQWFPGHMVKAFREMSDSARNVDAVCEILDARIPASSRNPAFDEVFTGKPRLIILNRADQAEAAATARWAAFFRKKGMGVLETDSKTGKGVNAFSGAIRALLREKLAAYAEKGQSGRSIRAMIVGIPNVGKSTFINRLAGRKAAETSDRPGVTRGRQWISAGRGLELMDTPGVLWPKFESPTAGENLAFTGAVRDEILDRTGLAANLCVRLRERNPESLSARYHIEPEVGMTGDELLTAAARKRGFLISGGEVDLERMAVVLLDEFRGGKLGRITLEEPPVEEKP